MAVISTSLFFLALSCIFLRPFISYLVAPQLDCFLWVVFALSACLRIALNRKQIAVTAIDYAVLFFMASITISLFTSVNPLNSLSRLCWYSGYAATFYFIRTCDERAKGTVLKTMFFSCFLLCLYGLYQYFFGFKLVLDFLHKQPVADAFAIEWLNRKRIFATFFSPNAYAGYLIMLVPLCIYLRQIEKADFTRRLFFLTIAACIANLILTASISGIFSILGACLFVVALKKRRRVMVMMASLAIILVLLTLLYVRYRSDTISLNPTISYRDRITYYKEALSMIARRPWRGIGIGNFQGRTSLFVHNSYLQVWIETGVMGFIALLTLVGVAIKQGIRRINIHAAVVCALVAFVIDNLLSFTFFLPEIGWVWWLVLGLIVS